MTASCSPSCWAVRQLHAGGVRRRCGDGSIWLRASVSCPATCVRRLPDRARARDEPQRALPVHRLARRHHPRRDDGERGAGRELRRQPVSLCISQALLSKTKGADLEAFRPPTEAFDVQGHGHCRSSIRWSPSQEEPTIEPPYCAGYACGYDLVRCYLMQGRSPTHAAAAESSCKRWRRQGSGTRRPLSPSAARPAAGRPCGRSCACRRSGCSPSGTCRWQRWRRLGPGPRTAPSAPRAGRGRSADSPEPSFAASDPPSQRRYGVVRTPA